jgi:hypothetical protein
VTCMPGSPLDYLGAPRVVHDLLEGLDGVLALPVSFARSFVWRAGDRDLRLIILVRKGDADAETHGNQQGSRTE